jgi:hypothetical protein
LKRERGGVRLDKEIERIDHRHLRGEVHFDLEFGRLLRKDEPRQPVALRILLPVHEVICRRHLERIAQDRRARMRRRTQAHGLPEIDRSVVFVVRNVMQCDEDRLGKLSGCKQNTVQVGSSTNNGQRVPTGKRMDVLEPISEAQSGYN